MCQDVNKTCPNKKSCSSDWEMLISEVQARLPLWNDGHCDNKKIIITSEPSLEVCGIWGEAVYAMPLFKICTKKSQSR
jgi:hypothetical protein